MPTIITRGAASAQGFGFAAGSGITYVEDVFSTYLYAGTGATQSITNNLNLFGDGGLVWLKNRSNIASSAMFDTNNGAGNYIESDSSSILVNTATGITSFNGNGFTVSGTNSSWNTSGDLYASWSFRQKKKFFDVVTYTGNNTTRSIAHNLGSVPGCIIIKCLTRSVAWAVYHRSLPSPLYALELQTNNAPNTSVNFWNNTAPTDSVFYLGNNDRVNDNSQQYVAYLFANDAGGFGEYGNENIVSCGGFTTSAGGSATINLGYEPGMLIVRSYSEASAFSNWQMIDNTRTLQSVQTTPTLYADLTAAENNQYYYTITPSGFTYQGAAVSENFVYIAIRRGPMRPPVTATSFFAPVLYTGTNADNRLVNTGLFTDMIMARIRAATSSPGFVVSDRVTGYGYLGTSGNSALNTDADSIQTPTVGFGYSFSAMNGFGVGNDATANLNLNTTTDNQLCYAFRRYPRVFDIRSYTGTGSNTTVSHALKTAPELMLVKKTGAGTGNWAVYSAATGNTNYLLLNANAQSASGSTYWNNTSPTASVFSVGTATDVNANTEKYVAYLFATFPKVTKVGSYTGTGTGGIQVDCGFSAGSRFVMIKRTDNTGDWYVWDSVRGIVSGNDPYLLINGTAAETTGTDYVDTYSLGFEVAADSTVPGLNANGGTYLFFAIA